MINEEGGIDVEEFRFASLVDRVATTGAVWLGLTVQCAQCHTHKFDPITQREYYRFLAFFDNVDEPDLDLPDPAIAARRAEIERQGSRPSKPAWPTASPTATSDRTWDVLTPTRGDRRIAAPSSTIQARRLDPRLGPDPATDRYEVEVEADLPASPRSGSKP